MLDLSAERDIKAIRHMMTHPRLAYVHLAPAAMWHVLEGQRDSVSVGPPWAGTIAE